MTNSGNGTTATLVRLLAKSASLKDQQSIVGLFVLHLIVIQIGILGEDDVIFKNNL